MGASRFDEDVDVVFFDIDNTLYDFEASMRATLEHLQERYADLLGGWHPEDLEARYWAANRSIPEAERLELIERDPHAYRAANWRALLGRDLADRVPKARREALALELADAFWGHRAAGMRDAQYELCDDTVRALLKTHTVGVISNGPPKLQRPKLEALGYANLFDEDLVFISGEFGEHKPSPRIFEAAAKAAGAEPDRCLMIGDSRECDMPSKRLGFRTILFDGKCVGHDCSGDEFPPDVLATHYRDVRGHLGLK